VEELERARRFGDFGQAYASCAVVHPWLTSCKSVPIDRFIKVAKWMVTSHLFLLLFLGWSILLSSCSSPFTELYTLFRCFYSNTRRFSRTRHECSQKLSSEQQGVQHSLVFMFWFIKVYLFLPLETVRHWWSLTALYSLFLPQTQSSYNPHIAKGPL